MHAHVARATRYAALCLLLVAAVLAAMAGPFSGAARAGTPPTIVSLTFDDGNADQYTNAFPLLQQYGMHGTFYIATGYTGVNPGYMTLPQLQNLASAGNEIGGHTVLHPDLAQLSADEATREVCQSRNTLLNWGFQATDFAYPFASFNSATENIAQQCGFNSARADSGLHSPYGCAACAVSETVPPADPYAVQAPTSIQSNWSLADIESLVTQAENGGGWMPIVFHHICDSNCDPYSVTPATFGAFLAWLNTQNVSVQTVAQVIGGSVQPAVSPPQAAPAPAGSNGVANASLETTDPYRAGQPACWTTNTSGSNSASFSLTGSAHSGSAAETITMGSFSSGDARLIVKQDLGQCAPTAVPGDSYVASAWYQSTVSTRFVFWYRDANGGWHYWIQSPQFGASSSYTQAVWGTPSLPSGATAVSYGLDIAANGTLTTDDYSLSDTGGPPTAPSVSLTSPSAGATMSGQVALSATASSAVGVTRVDYLVNGVVVASSSSSPYSATWDSSRAGDGPVSVTARATDVSGNQTTSQPVTATVSNAASRGGNMLPNASLESYSGSGSAPDCWQQGGFGTSTYTWSRTSSAHSGNWAQSVTVTSYTSGDRKLTTAQNSSACSPRVNPGSTYTLGAWYQSTQPTHILVYYLNASGSWVYWTQSPVQPATPGWAHATWTTPAVPAGASALSFGLNLGAAGTLTTDDYTMTGN
jgi:peptidoglycan/xylan/chitin deacetylase (PgdA/CDA1 family)